ncbi:MAG: alcohol dehydrogenase catalytic domain-containing protein [Chloroflexota bacterium]|jgi:L-iditol 2-dehydrogenase
MKAAVLRGPGELAVEEVPIPEVPPNGLLLKVMACGLCGSDLRSYQHGMRYDKEWQILGHELNGIVAEVGADVKDYKVGDRLAVAADVSCHNCYYCDRALYNLCENWKLIGAHYPGAMAEYMLLSVDILRRGIVHRIPAGLTHIDAALAEPMSGVLASHHNIGLELGETVAIIGAGPIGFIHVEIAKARGARPIIIGRNPQRLAKAESLGVEAAILVDDQDVISEIRRLTDGYGVDVSIVAASSAIAQAQAVEMVRKRGRVVLYGGLPKETPTAELNTNIIHYDELTVFGAFSYHPRFHQLALEILDRGQIQVEKIISNTYPLEYVVEAFESAMARKEIKAIITPNVE